MISFLDPVFVTFSPYKKGIVLQCALNRRQLRMRLRCQLHDWCSGGGIKSSLIGINYRVTAVSQHRSMTNGNKIMKIILLDKIQRLGEIGDIVEVNSGYARNFLIANKKALYASKENISEVVEINLQEAKASTELTIQEVNNILGL